MRGIWNVVIAAYGSSWKTLDGYVSMSTESSTVPHPQQVVQVGRPENNRLVSAALSAKTLYDDMLSPLYGVQPDEWTYSSLISIWARAGFPEGAEYFLHAMQSRGLPPTQLCYYALIEGWLSAVPGLRQGQGQGKEHVQDTACDGTEGEGEEDEFERIKERWADKSQEQALRRVAGLFHAMSVEAVASGQPTHYCYQAYSSIVHRWPHAATAVHGDAPSPTDEDTDDNTLSSSSSSSPYDASSGAYSQTCCLCQ